MMEFPLTVPALLRRAAGVFPGRPVVTQTGAAERSRSNWGALGERVLRLMEVLRTLGVREGDRVASLAWNHQRHVELYFAAPSVGAVLHTLNARLAPGQLSAIVEHAGDAVVFADRELSGLVDRSAPGWSAVREIVWMGRGAGEEAEGADYERLLAASEPRDRFPDLDERAAAGLCYTSGTTGEPKGVLYSHRAFVLHAMGICMRDSFGLGADDTVLPVVPLFHANGWGLPYGAAWCGAALVLPGPYLRGGQLVRLMREEGVTVAAGVPTVWQMILQALREDGEGLALRQAVVGGAPASEALLRELDEAAIPAVQSWGMTELTPVGTVSRLRPGTEGLSESGRLRLRACQGTPVPGVEARIRDAEGRELPWDGESPGELEVRGPWVAAGYYRGAQDDPAFTADGWFRTGDVAVIDPSGYVRLTDRKKDLIKVGGEWLSSVALENAVRGCAGVAEAAAVARPDPVRGEAPVVFLVAADPGSPPEAAAIRAALREAGFARWQIPKLGDIRRIEEIPRTSVGKFDKVALRKRVSGG